MSPESSASRPPPRTGPGRGSRRFRPGLMGLEDRALLTTITVTSLGDAGAGTLRQAIASAAAGDTIQFAASLNGGTIALTGGALSIVQDVNILGPGSGLLSVDGGGKSGVFAIKPATLATPPVLPNVTIDGLTIAHGLTNGGGGGIDATQANLTLAADTFLANKDQGGGAGGGGVLVGFGTLSISGSKFLGNVELNGTGGALSLSGTPTTITATTFANNTGSDGGAISEVLGNNLLATLTIDGGQFNGNQASSSGIALGGAIDNAGTTTVRNSSFSTNQAVGPGIAQGGAIHSMFGSSLTVSGSSFVYNQAFAAGPQGVASGGALSSDAGTSQAISGSTFSGNAAVATGTARGGAIANNGQAAGTSPAAGLSITSSAFLGNAASGLAGPTGAGGNAFGGAVSNSLGFLNLTGSFFQSNQVMGGNGVAGGTGGIADGGAVTDSQSPLTVLGSIFASNTARAGSGGQMAGYASGGGVSQEFDGDPTASTIADSQFYANRAIGGNGTGTVTPVSGGSGSGGGLSLGQDKGPTSLTGNLFSYNSAIGGDGSPAGSPTGPGTGGAGGPGSGGGLAVVGANLALVGGSIVANSAIGGNAPAGNAGVGFGGGLSNGLAADALALSGVTFVFNKAGGGAGYLTGGLGEGGGLRIAGIVSITAGVVYGNEADGGPGSPTGLGLGGGILVYPGGVLTVDPTTVIVGNKASTAGNDRYPN